MIIFGKRWIIEKWYIPERLLPQQRSQVWTGASFVRLKARVNKLAAWRNRPQVYWLKVLKCLFWRVKALRVCPPRNHSKNTRTKLKDWQYVVMFLPLFLSDRAKLGHGLLSGQYSKPPMKSELIEQVMKEEYKVLNWVCPAPKLGP